MVRLKARISLLLFCSLSALAKEGAIPIRFEGALQESAPDSAPDFRRIRVFDPYERVEIEFEGYPLQAVLDHKLGASWRKLGPTHELKMKCQDGYQVSVPLSRILEHEALVAIRRVDKPGFDLLKKDVTPEKRVELSPAYLVWENIRDRTIRAEGDFGWPFQWVEASLQKIGEGDPLPIPRNGSNRSALRGYTHFKIHCMKCHSLGGIGGKVGPELHYPKNVTGYWQKARLVEWILNPASFRIPNGMPPLAPEHPERKKIARDVVEYLGRIPEKNGGRP
ncbi:MAG: c-type cytochrome [Bdellovibrionales bacterium]|nr:c-type cytochrome [Bdellovibrionales bacterium]